MSYLKINQECEKFGYEYFGPFLFGFTLWLKRSLEKTGCKKVFFFSRDGYMMKRAFEILSEQEYELEYIHLSRQSIRQALIYTACDYEKSLQYVTKERYISTIKILKYYGFTTKEIADLEKRYSLDLDSLILYSDLATDKLIRNIYLDNIELINSRSKQQAEYLRKYLSQCGFANKCAIVDIGWHGSMQLYLEKFIDLQKINASVEGFYVGINPLDSLNGKVHGFIFEPQRLEKRKDILCFLGGYEKLFQSLEGSTTGYEEKNNLVYPVLLPYEYENKSSVIFTIETWQNNAIRYIKEHIEESSSVSYEILTKKLIDFGKRAPKWGIDMFKELFIIDGEKQLFVSPKNIFMYTLNELKSDLSNSIWKTGFMKSVFRLPLPYFQLYRIIRK